MNRYRLSSALLFTSLLVALALTGCAVSTSTPLSSPPLAPRVSPLSHRATETQAIFFPLGAVPYDNFSLPLVSPDGRFIATQTGVPPRYETVLASKDSSVPEATRIRIYRLIEGGEPQLVTTLDIPALLGRSVDATGFLLEAPQPDGSRWIGKASWNEGNIEWLVQDEFVNCFASLGPDQRLAWSRRALEEDHFSLVIKHGERSFVYGEDQTDSWLYPTWSGRGDGLFALHLSSTNLATAHLIATSPAAIRQSLRTLPLIIDGSIHWANQTMSSVVNRADFHPPGSEQLVFFHPGESRMAIWKPAAGATRPIYLTKSSLAATISGPDALVTTTNEILRQNLQNLRDRIKLAGGGAHIARPTSKKEWPYILLTPREGIVSVSGLYLGTR